MIEILPIKVLTDEDAQIFGNLNVALGKLQRSSIPVATGIVITPPNLKLKVTMEHYDFGAKEVFEQSLILVKKEIHSITVPEILQREAGKHKKFLLNQKIVKSVRDLWISLLDTWLEQIKQRLWKDGFYKGITEGLEPQVVIFVKKVAAFGNGYFDPLQDDTVINIREGKFQPNDLKNLDEIVKSANKKLLIPHEYEWIVENGIKLIKILPFTSSYQTQEIINKNVTLVSQKEGRGVSKEQPSVAKVYLDVTNGIISDRGADGIFLASENIFDLNKPRDSFEDLVFKLVESASTFPNSPVLFKLADKSEGMGKVRGALRLLHQESLIEPMIEALDFVRNKREFKNVHIVIPFVRGLNEFLLLKQKLAVKKFVRRNGLEIWMEAATPENIINLEDYIVSGLDGIVLNLDELIAYLNGFDQSDQELVFYKNEVDGLIKFLEDGVKLLHKSKIPFIAYGSLNLYPKVLEFLVEKGVYGIVVERFESQSAHELLNQAEKRMILRRSS